MSVTAERKKELMTQFGSGETDTGSPEIQIAVLSERITKVDFSRRPFRIQASSEPKGGRSK